LKKKILDRIRERKVLEVEFAISQSIEEKLAIIMELQKTALPLDKKQEKRLKKATKVIDKEVKTMLGRK
jgi:hypothetical protein